MCPPVLAGMPRAGAVLALAFACVLAFAADMSRMEPPPGILGHSAPGRSRHWTGAKRYRNLEWHPEGVARRIPTEREPPPLGPTGPTAPNGSDFARVMVQGKSYRKNRPFAMEICCGHAGLTAALWDAGFEGV